MELNTARLVKGNKRRFYRYTGDKRKARKNVGPLWKATGDLVTQNIEKTEILNDIFICFLWEVFQPHDRRCRTQGQGLGE